MHLSGDGQEAVGYKDKKEFTGETKRRTVAVAITSMLIMISEGGHREWGEEEVNGGTLGNTPMVKRYILRRQIMGMSRKRCRL